VDGRGAAGAPWHRCRLWGTGMLASGTVQVRSDTVLRRLGGPEPLEYGGIYR